MKIYTQHQKPNLNLQKIYTGNVLNVRPQQELHLNKLDTVQNAIKTFVYIASIKTISIRQPVSL